MGDFHSKNCPDAIFTIPFYPWGEGREGGMTIVAQNDRIISWKKIRASDAWEPQAAVSEPANKSLLSRLIKLIVNNYPDFLRTPEWKQPLPSHLAAPSKTPGEPSPLAPLPV